MASCQQLHLPIEFFTVSISCKPHYYLLFLHPFLVVSIIEMFSKSFAAFILLVLTSSVKAQVAFEPMLCGPATPVAGEVQYPTHLEPCGNMSEYVPQYMDDFSFIQADANGIFTVNFTNFGS
jgi:hypothetical protein